VSLSDLYQEIILDHYKNPRNYGDIDDPDMHVEDNNPSCGDELEVNVKFDEDEQVIDDISFTGEGCAISMASASLMSDRLEGKSIEDAEDLRERFKSMITADDGEQDIDELKDELGDLVSLKGVIKFPIRVKCANLAWNTFKKGLNAKDEKGLPVNIVQNK
jgi:nitrogen fixation NifU-like protein